jgi:hypothetical protein
MELLIVILTYLILSNVFKMCVTLLIIIALNVIMPSVISAINVFC